MDLFAAAHNAVVPFYFSVTKGDTGAVVRDALHQLWYFPLMFTFHPPHLISQTLGNLSEVQGELILITPVWHHAMWWGEVIDLSVCPPDLPTCLALQQQGTKELCNLQLVAWKLCTSASVRWGFGQNQLPSMHFQSKPPHSRLMSLHGNLGVNGVEFITWQSFLSQRSH